MHSRTARILTTHVGSLPRSEPLLQLLVDKEQGKTVDERCCMWPSQTSGDAKRQNYWVVFSNC